MDMDIPDKETLEKVIANNANKKDAAKIVHWLKTSEGQKWLSERMDEDEFIDIESESIIHSNDIPSEEIYNQILQRFRRMIIRRWVYRCAAVIIPFAIIFSFFYYLNTSFDLLSEVEYEEITVPKGEKTQLIFQDGSKVYLNSESRIRFPRKFSLTERKVSLEGEGFFEIKKNKHRPFIVDLKCVQIEVIGTTFNVKAYPQEQNISVILESGGIQLQTDMSNYYKLKPGDRALYNRKSGYCQITHPDNYLNYSAWRKNELIFENSSLHDVLKTLSRSYDVSFVIVDSTSLNYSYTLNTNSKDLIFILKELEKITPVRFTKNKDEILIDVKKN